MESNVPMVGDPDIRLFVHSSGRRRSRCLRPRTVAEGGLGRRAALVGGLYAFAQELKERLGVPVGVIAYFGGTAIES